MAMLCTLKPRIYSIGTWVQLMDQDMAKGATLCYSGLGFPHPIVINVLVSAIAATTASRGAAIGIG